MGSDEPRNTLAVHLWAGQVRGAIPNGATMMRPAQALRMVGHRRSLRDLFVAAYPRFAPAIRPVAFRYVQERHSSVPRVREALRAAGLAP